MKEEKTIDVKSVAREEQKEQEHARDKEDTE